MKCNNVKIAHCNEKNKMLQIVFFFFWIIFFSYDTEVAERSVGEITN